MWLVQHDHVTLEIESFGAHLLGSWLLKACLWILAFRRSHLTLDDSGEMDSSTVARTRIRSVIEHQKAPGFRFRML